MNTLSRNPTTRASLTNTATHNARWFASLLAGSAMLGSSALALDNLWTGATSSDWNDPSNWSDPHAFGSNHVPTNGAGHPGDEDAVVNTTTPNIATITANISANPRDIKVGVTGGTTGQLNHHAGTAATGAGNWALVGSGGGTGRYNLADTTTTGGILTGFGTGSGSLTANQLRVGQGGGATGGGNLAINTTGTVTVTNDIFVAEDGTGVINMDAGTLNRTGGWMVVGKSGTVGNGTFNMSGGTMTGANENIAGLDPGGVGFINISGGTFTSGGNLQVGRGGGTGTVTVTGAATVMNLNNEFSVGANDNNSKGTFNLTAAPLTVKGETFFGRNTGGIGTVNVNSGTVAINNWLNVGRDGGTGTLNMTGGSMTVEREVRIGWGSTGTAPDPVIPGTGTLAMSGGATLTGGTIDNNIAIGANKGIGTATVTGPGTVLTSVNQLFVGNDIGSVGTLTVSGGTVNSGNWFAIGREGSTGTLTIEGSGTVNQGITDPGGSRLELTNANKPSTATLNLDGGTLTTNGIINGAGGNCNVNLNGGLLKPRINNGTFLQGMTNVTVKAGGARIDTDGRNISINQSMIGVAGDGGLIKSGEGFLQLGGTNSYTGTTIVSAGSLGGIGSVAGPLVVGEGATVAPGASAGTFTAGATTISGSYACELDGENGDRLVVNGALDLSATTDSLDLSEPGFGATRPVYIIATYTTLTGDFGASVSGLPDTYVLHYNYLGGNQIALVRPITPYDTWVGGYFPGEADPEIVGGAADPDGDGQSNSIEFALGGEPDDGSNNAKVYHLAADSSDAGAANELLMTIAVRNGGDGPGLNPVFTPVSGGLPTATQDGATYTIQGSTDLADFASSTVTAVATVTTGLPAAPAGYEYRTFSLDGSDGLPAKGFLRVNVTP